MRGEKSMAKRKTVQEILKSTTPQAATLVSKILEIENEYRSYHNLSQLKEKENELCDRIVRLLEQEVRS
jgi:hypothetical protein